MPIDNESIGWLAEVAGISAEDLTAKINSDKEERVEKPQGQWFTEDELTRRDSSKYNEGKEAGPEMKVKDLKKEYGYDFEGKDMGSFLKHHNEVLKSKYSKEPNDRVTELEQDLKRQKTTFEEEINGYKTQISDFKSRYDGERVNNKLLSIMPKETSIKSSAIVTLFKNEHSIVEENGQMVVKKNGETMKDTKTATPLKLDEVFSEYIVKEGYAKPKNGRGGQNNFGNNSYSSGTPSEFQKEWQRRNPDKSANSPEYIADYKEWRKQSSAA